MNCHTCDYWRRRRIECVGAPPDSECRNPRADAGMVLGAMMLEGEMEGCLLHSYFEQREMARRAAESQIQLEL